MGTIVRFLTQKPQSSKNLPTEQLGRKHGHYTIISPQKLGGTYESYIYICICIYTYTYIYIFTVIQMGLSKHAGIGRHLAEPIRFC